MPAQSVQGATRTDAAARESMPSSLHFAALPRCCVGFVCEALRRARMSGETRVTSLIRKLSSHPAPPDLAVQPPSLMARVTASALALTAKVLSGATARWYDIQPDTCQRVYFANHTSHLDVLVLWSALPAELRALTRPVAAKDYWEKGPIRRYLANHVFNA